MEKVEKDGGMEREFSVEWSGVAERMIFFVDTNTRNAKQKVLYCFLIFV